MTRRGAWLIHCIINVQRHVVSHLITYTPSYCLLVFLSLPLSFLLRSPSSFFSFHSMYIRVPPSPPISTRGSRSPSRESSIQVKIIPGPSSISCRVLRAQICHGRPSSLRISRFVSRISSSTGIRNGPTFENVHVCIHWDEISRERNDVRPSRSVRSNFTIEVIAGRLGIVDGFIGREGYGLSIGIKRG